MLVTIEQGEPEEQDVAVFLSSLEWLYFTHRYSPTSQRVLLRLLTLSGLHSDHWKQWTRQLMEPSLTANALRQVIKQGYITPAQLRPAIEEIWATATRAEMPVGEPPASPDYLRAFGYTQERYLNDLVLLYGLPLPAGYAIAWPAVPPSSRPSSALGAFARNAVALMGATAGAIDWLVERGTAHDYEDERRQ